MNGRTGEPRLAAAASWAVLAASFGLSAATWVALAQMAGFTGHILVVPLAWLMPVAVDGYVVVALVVWMSPVPAKVARFARTNTYCAASVGVVAQSAFHALTVWSQTATAWRAALAAVVGALPPAVAALAVHMRALLRRENGHQEGTTNATASSDVNADIAARGADQDHGTDPPVDQPERAVSVRTGNRSPRRDSAKAKVAKVRQRNPNASQEVVARKAELSVQTVRRHWPTTEPANRQRAADSNPQPAADSDPTHGSDSAGNGHRPQAEVPDAKFVPDTEAALT